MDTIIFLEVDNLDFSLVPELNEKQKCILDDYIHLQEHLVEIAQLYEMYRFNYGMLHQSFNMRFSDVLERKKAFEFETNDYAIINSIISNLLGAGKMLADSLEVFCRELNHELYNSLRKDYICKEYDTSFAYRLLYLLRNYTQHGHPCVSVMSKGSEITCCFDLLQISNTDHYNHNKKAKEEFEKILEEIANKRGDIARIQFTSTVAQYNISILKIYSGFLELIESLVRTTDMSLLELIETTPSLIQLVGPKSSYRVLAFNDGEGTTHTIDFEETSADIFARHRESANLFFSNQVASLEKSMEGIRLVSIDDLP